MGREVRPEIEESGKRLATFMRKGFAREGKPDVELRVVLDEYEGKPFVTVRQREMSYSGENGRGGMGNGGRPIAGPEDAARHIAGRHFSIVTGRRRACLYDTVHS
jgi:hypothetical protein